MSDCMAGMRLDGGALLTSNPHFQALQAEVSRRERNPHQHPKEGFLLSSLLGDSFLSKRPGRIPPAEGVPLGDCLPQTPLPQLPHKDRL